MSDGTYFTRTICRTVARDIARHAAELAAMAPEEIGGVDEGALADQFEATMREQLRALMPADEFAVLWPDPELPI